jgi:hypothetical protein
VTGVHRLQHVEALAAAHLAQDDAVRTHAQRVLEQVALVDAAAAFGALGAGFEAHHVDLLQLQFSGVFDGDDALVGADLL